MIVGYTILVDHKMKRGDVIAFDKKLYRIIYCYKAKDGWKCEIEPVKPI
jgi:hypothetical protein